LTYRVLRQSGSISVECEACYQNALDRGHIVNAIVGDPLSLAAAKLEADELAGALIHGVRWQDCLHARRIDGDVVEVLS
jgi:hypothetical protein